MLLEIMAAVKSILESLSSITNITRIFETKSGESSLNPIRAIRPSLMSNSRGAKLIRHLQESN